MAFELVAYRRDVLYEQVWAEPMLNVAKSYRISNVALAKICRKLGVPVPGRGYWARRTAGQKLKIPPLPPLKPGQPAEVKVHRYHSPHVTLRAAIEEKLREEKKPDAAIVVGAELGAPHPLVRKAELALGRRAKTKKDGRLLHGAQEGCLDIAVSWDSLDRALRILDALLKALEARGCSVEVVEPAADEQRGRGEGERPPPRITRVLVGEDWIAFGLSEGQDLLNTEERRVPEGLADWERLRLWQRLPPPIYRSNGILTLEIKREQTVYARRRWRDGHTQRVEKCLNDFIRNLFITAEAIRGEREESARRQREREEAERTRRSAEEERRREVARVTVLEREIGTWSFAKSVREYVADARARMDPSKFQKNIEGGIPFEEWLAWAAEYADRIDPLQLDEPTDEEGERRQ